MPSRITLVVPSTGRSTSAGPARSSSHSCSSAGGDVVEQVPLVDNSMRASTTCTLVIVSELAPVPTVMAALTGDAAGAADADRVVMERLSGCDARGPVPPQAARVNDTGASHTAHRPSSE